MRCSRFYGAFVPLLLIINANVDCAVFWGTCPMKNLSTNFELSPYQGRWFEYLRYGSPIFELGIKCVEFNYTLGNASSTLRIDSRAKGSSGWWNNKEIWKKGALTVSDDNPKNTSSKMRFAMQGFLPFIDKVSGSYYVLSVDYKHYALIWSCRNFVFFNVQHAWVLTRKRQPLNLDDDPDYVKGRIYDDLKKNGFVPDEFKKSEQTDCDPFSD